MTKNGETITTLTLHIHKLSLRTPELNARRKSKLFRQVLLQTFIDRVLFFSSPKLINIYEFYVRKF